MGDDLLRGIPRFPEFRDIELGDRASIGELFNAYPTEISERTFGSIFVWRGFQGRSRLAELDGHLLISWYKPKFGKVLLPPVGPEPVRIVSVLNEQSGLLSERFEGAYGITEPVTAGLASAGYQVGSLRDEWDYVYRVQDLVGLKGPRYHTQRKELKRLTLSYDVSFDFMAEHHQKACLELEEKWCDIKRCSFDNLSSAEDAALKEALLGLDELGFVGGVALVEGRIQALIIGEKLNSSTAVIHFEKANPEIRGLYQFINQQFCEKALSAYEFVNREQDVGEPGLRRAKTGYHPDHFVEKSIAYLG